MILVIVRALEETRGERAPCPTRAPTPDPPPTPELQLLIEPAGSLDAVPWTIDRPFIFAIHDIRQAPCSS